MATLSPFKALRPTPYTAEQVAAVPYDVVNTDEARQLAEGNPLSFLRVSRAEIELPPAADPYAEAVYRRAVQNFKKLKENALVVEAEPSVYFYRLQMGGHVQTGVGACFSLDEYDSGVIKKHERTRRDKEDDRTRHMIALRAQTGPVFLTYRASTDVSAVASRVTAGAPLFDFEAPDGVRHSLWRAAAADGDRIVSAFGSIPNLYIADGHHRAASAARARQEIPGANTFLAVAFPHDQTQILAYNRIVKDLRGVAPGDFMRAVRERFTAAPGPAQPSRRGQIAMYLEHDWHTLERKSRPVAAEPIASLDVSVLEAELLSPILKIGDIRIDKRIDFVGGARGTKVLEEAVDSGRAAVAFSLFPVSVDDLMTVSDAGGIMPPKSTWFEPKLRDGLLIHVI